MTGARDGIGTCVQSLLVPGECCAESCQRTATIAVLCGDSDDLDSLLTEHSRCVLHSGMPDRLAGKLFNLAREWT